MAGNISLFISSAMINLLAITFCWVTWAGRVRTRRRRTVDTMMEPLQGSPADRQLLYCTVPLQYL